MNDPVDVLIIGAGASGAAVAWSLADTKMHILCLDQGGWMNSSEYPSTGRDWEAKFYGEWSSSPNVRGRPEIAQAAICARADEYPIDRRARDRSASFQAHVVKRRLDGSAPRRITLR